MHVERKGNGANGKHPRMKGKTCKHTSKYYNKQSINGSKKIKCIFTLDVSVV